ncbi:MAG: DNA primase [Bifidobacteriaceae bacterium]|jgi:DNA primase|nr:DNA primase [Bifidobacteriaceae bacterium]
MAGRISAEGVEAVRAAVRVEQIVGERVDLKRAGVGSLKGLCPFHDERTASFNVRPQLGLWHCFGCGEGGDTIAFVMKADALSFTEAIEYLAGRYGITLQYEESGGGRERDPSEPTRARLVEANRLAAAYYAEQLGSAAGRPARDFLRGRNFDRLVADLFGVGFAPAAWDDLTRHLRGRGFAEVELAAAGLTSPGRQGPIDRFRGRIVWPIRDLTGAVVGFGGRRLSDDDQGPKYLNTPETLLYRKSQLLYGVDLAKKAIARNRRVAVVEGYTDVMAAHLAGVEEVVATCGTAFGNDHIRVVRRLLGDVGSPSAGVQMSDGASIGGKVVFTFDGDEAGQKAAMRAFGEEQQFYAGTFVAVAPDGQDPCELWVGRGAAAVRELIDGAEPMFLWAVRAALRSVDLETAEGRVAGMRLAAPMVAGIRDDALRRDYTRLLAGWVGQDESLVRREVAGARRGRGGGRGSGRPGGPPDAGPRGVPGGGPGGGLGGAAGGPGARGEPGEGWRAPRDSVGRSEHDALAAVLQLPGLVPAQFDDLPGDVFQVPELRAVHDAVRAAGGVGAARAEGSDPAAWMAEVRDLAAPPVAGVVTALAVETLPIREGGEAEYVVGVVRGLLQLGMTRRLGELRAKLGRQDAAGDAEGKAATLMQINELMRERGALRAD